MQSSEPLMPLAHQLAAKKAEVGKQAGLVSGENKAAAVGLTHPDCPGLPEQLKRQELQQQQQQQR